MATVTESLVDTSLWFPKPASDIAAQIDGLFYFITVLSGVVFFALFAIVAYFIVKYRRSEQRKVGSKSPSHNDLLEITWSALPFLILLFIFFWAFRDYMTLSIAPPGGNEIKVSAKKWLWQFEYPQGIRTIGDVVVPIGKPTYFLMSSEDVIHSFYLPNFRVKRDVIPNRYTKVWIQPNRIGKFQIFCAEFCGDGHSQMLGTLTVVSPEDYDKWVASGGGKSLEGVPLIDIGKRVYDSAGCNVCHSLDGAKGIGPSLKGMFGKVRPLAAGSVMVDENYVRESIEVPTAKVAAGFQPIMPSYKGVLSPREIDGIIELIKSLK